MKTQSRRGSKRAGRILSDNYVRPDETERTKSRIRETGNDKITVRLKFAYITLTQAWKIKKVFN